MSKVSPEEAELLARFSEFLAHAGPPPRRDGQPVELTEEQRAWRQEISKDPEWRQFLLGEDPA